MPSFERESRRIVIAGASSLLGADLKSLLEESKFADWDFRLVDEEEAAGTLTEAGGEPAVIQPVEEGSFESARFVFFAGSGEFTRINMHSATAVGARVVDLSGSLASEGGSLAWFPKLDDLLARQFPSSVFAYAIPSAAATAAASLSLALRNCGLQRLVINCFRPVSEAGHAGIEELESQTGQLLSFQSVGQPVFDTQVAFNMVNHYGPECSQKLEATRTRVRAETKACLGEKAKLPAIQVIHSPVFYGTTFSACAELDPDLRREKIEKVCTDAGFVLMLPGEAGPNNLSAAGEKVIQLAAPEQDPSQAGTWWFWGAADNIRLPAAHAVKLAEMLA
ncbi:MAG TPA: Asd/ArgC dimerization domain-containing protein [Candidatus Acidoferrum sp.]|nr:Asd/ArgC dimerization domain-containing protein [Candidatus Acidoferrum sp.]